MADAAAPAPLPQPLPVRAASEALLLTHAVLVGLTPLIPIPILDDAVKAAIERRLVREVARASGQELDDKTVELLAGEEEGSVLVSIAKGIITFPLKLIFRKLFVVLEVKRASDLASKTYHRGRLLDLALASSLVAPRGHLSPKDVRAAVDAACESVSVSPLGYAFTSVFESSKGALESLGKDLISRLKKGGPAKVVEAVEEQAKPEARATGVVGRLEEALRSVPREHFDELESRFEERLGIRLTRR